MSLCGFNPDLQTIHWNSDFQKNGLISDKEKVTALKEIQTLNKRIEAYNSGLTDKNQTISFVPTPPFKVVRVCRSAQEFANFYASYLLPEDQFPNSDELLKWEQSHKATSQPIARTLAEAVLEDFVDFPTFVEALKSSIGQAEHQIEGRPYGVTYLGQLNKSGLWTFQIAAPLFKTLPQVIRDESCIPYRGEVFQNKTGLDPQEKVLHWMVVDDACYEGRQMCNGIQTIAKGLFSQIPEGIISIYLAIPLMQTRAEEAFRSLEKDLNLQYGDRIRIVPCPAQYLRSKWEIYRDANLDEEDLAPVEKRAAFLDTNHVVASYLSHKVPDEVSRDQGIPAPRIEPPYKSEHYREITRFKFRNGDFQKISQV